MERFKKLFEKNVVLIQNCLCALSVSLFFISISKHEQTKANIVFFLVLFGLFFFKDKRFETVEFQKPAYILGFLYSFCTVVDYEYLENRSFFYRTFESPFHRVFFVFSIIVELVGFTFIFSKFLGHLFVLLSSKKDSQVPFSDENYSFSKVWRFLILCWIPYFVIFYPGVISIDSVSEISMQIGISPISNHHPIIHQWMIKVFLILGRLCGNNNFGIGLYSFFQMLFLSSSVALSISFLQKAGVSKKLCKLVFIFFAFVPFNPMYGITMWKDIMMGVFSLTSFIFLYKIDDETHCTNNVLLYLPAFFSLFLFCVFRNNGFYAFCLFVPFYLFLSMKKSFIKKLVLFLVVFLSVLLYQNFIFNKLSILKSSVGESLSIPLQQIARTVRDNPDKITDEEYEILGEIFTNPRQLGDRYYSDSSDPVKDGSSFLADVFEKNPRKYIKLWWELFLRCPDTYFDAFFAENYGYWFPDVRYGVNITTLLRMEEKTFSQPFENSLIYRVVTLIQYVVQSIPGISVLYSISLYSWIIAFGITLLVVKKRMDLFPPIILIICLWITTLASPVFCEFRYLYGMVVTAPVFLAICISAKKKDNNLLEN